MDDQRKHKRLPVNLTCRLLCGNSTVLVQATVTDVSFGGMGTIVPVELPVGSIIEFQHSDFPFTHASSAVSRCRVIAVRPARGRFTGFRMGLAFETIDKDFVQKLLQWLQMQAFVQRKSLERTGAARPKWA